MDAQQADQALAALEFVTAHAAGDIEGTLLLADVTDPFLLATSLAALIEAAFKWHGGDLAAWTETMRQRFLDAAAQHPT